MLNGMNTASECSGKESQMESCTKPQYSAISDHSLIKGSPQDIRDWLMLLPAAFPVSRSQSPENEQGEGWKEYLKGAKK